MADTKDDSPSIFEGQFLQLEQILAATFREQPGVFLGDTPLAGITGEHLHFDQPHAVYIHLLAEDQWSATLYLLANPFRAAESDTSNFQIVGEESRLAYMEAREALRRCLHPNGAHPAQPAARARLHKLLLDGESATGNKSHALATHLAENTDRPRAFGVELVQFRDSPRGVKFFDLSGEIIDYYHPLDQNPNAK